MTKGQPLHTKIISYPNRSMLNIPRPSKSVSLWCCIFFSCFFVVYSFLTRHPEVPIPAFDAQRTKSIPPLSSPAKYANIAVLVEFRSIDLLVSAVMNIYHNIPSSWPIQIFHGQSNLEFIKSSPGLNPLMSNGRIILTEWKPKLKKDYTRNTNEIFTNISFWQQIQGDKILFFQLDSVMCSNSPHKITDFLHYDYIGAPWDVEVCCGLKGIPVGNGGFSLRSRLKTIQLLQILPWDNGLNEDAWYSVNLPRYVNASIPPIEIAKTFAVESIYYPHPMGVHKLLLSYRERRRLYKTCPEARLVPPHFFFF